ncbi:hypothetical protein [Terriglobus aquaticus]|uniref:Secreted protein n=1 Tax=Terriglobus aquaticus TaxID=940139 RepID=A0ABW9KIF8_9BACT|nr:hypothetical protein [Terriglobus aquaticus]
MIPRHTLLALSLLCASAAPVCLSAQINGIPSTAPTSGSQPQSDSAPAETQKPSNLIAPAVDHLSQVVSQIQLERWKSASRDETDSNLRSIERNLKSTLPDLVTTADAQPTSVAASLPVLRNLDALCAVMIRVSVTARSNAPTPQAESIAGALTALQSARNTLSDQVQSLATAQEKQLSTLQSTVATLTAKASTPPPPPPATAAPKTAPKKKKKKPTAAKPAQSAQTSAAAKPAPAAAPPKP